MDSQTVKKLAFGDLVISAQLFNCFIFFTSAILNIWKLNNIGYGIFFLFAFIVSLVNYLWFAKTSFIVINFEQIIVSYAWFRKQQKINWSSIAKIDFSKKHLVQIHTDNDQETKISLFSLNDGDRIIFLNELINRGYDIGKINQKYIKDNLSGQQLDIEIKSSAFWDNTISFALTLFFPLCYFFIWKNSYLQRYLSDVITDPNNWQKGIFYLISDFMFILPISLVIGVILNILLQKLIWQTIAKKSAQDIKFNFDWQELKFYAYCTEAMRIDHYRLSIIIPKLILGFIPFALSLLSGNVLIFFFGWLFISTGTESLILLWISRKLPRQTLILEHCSKEGFNIITNS